MAIYGPHYIPGKWCVTPCAFVDEVRQGFRLPRRFHVRDTTLREGDMNAADTTKWWKDYEARVKPLIAMAYKQ